MMEKKYDLVAWTENVTDPENARLYLLPSLDWDMQGPYFAEISKCQEEQGKNNGVITISLARKAIKAYEDNANFYLFTGHPGDGIRFTLKAAMYCIWANDAKRVDTGAGKSKHTQVCGALRGEFIRLCEKAIKSANQYRRTDVLLEDLSKEILKYYFQ